MWKKEHKVIVKDVTAQQIWQVWSDIENWPQWDSGLEACWWCTPKAEFKSGSTFNLKIKGGPTFKIFIADATPYKTFIDYTQFFLARMYDTHELKETAEGLEITNTTTMTGPLAWLWRKLVGEGVAKSIPQQTEHLIAMAKTK